MENSIIYAQFIGIIFSIIGAGILLNYNFYRKLAETMDDYPPVIFVVGIAGTILGLFMVNGHNIWSGEIWQILITIINWIILITGIITLAVTPLTLYIVKLWKNNSKVVLAEGSVVLITGLVLLYFGYLAQ
ncbi:hypothetical protein GF376_01270 [Candidatus Peregrinibacteria bacterium]|nr:hypothetical protein [Candidatus Peregrinibacteria bacterium]